LSCNEFDRLARWAARLCDPIPVRPEGPPGDTATGPPDLPALVALLQRNQVPLLGLNRTQTPAGFFDDPTVAAALAQESARLTRQRDEYAQVQATFAQAGIPAILIKAVAQTPVFPYTSDNVDTLVPADRARDARRLLRDLGYVWLRPIEEPGKTLFRKFHLGQEVSCIHLHERVAWGVKFLDERLIWQDYRPSPDPAVAILAPTDILLVTFAHSLYENKRVKLWDLARVRLTLAQGEVDWARAKSVASQKGWLDGLYVCILLYDYLEQALYREGLLTPYREEAWAGLSPSDRGRLRACLEQTPLHLPLPIPFILSKRLYYRKVFADRDRRASGKLYDLILNTANGVRLKAHIHSQPGMLFAISGLDGAGKTTQIKALEAAFRSAHLKTTTYWARGGASPLLRCLTRPLKALQYRNHSANPTLSQPLPQPTGQGEGTAAVPISGRFRHPLLRLGWTLVSGFDLWLRYTLRVTLPLLTGRIVLADRYVYDTLADWAILFDDPAAGEGFWGWLLTHTTPRPQRAFLLDVTPAQAARRQGETDAGVRATQADIYRRLAQRYHLITVNGDREPAAVSDPIVRDAVQTYCDHYWTWINALFLINPRVKE